MPEKRWSAKHAKFAKESPLLICFLCALRVLCGHQLFASALLLWLFRATVPASGVSEVGSVRWRTVIGARHSDQTVNN
jgi:hypothetical protein